MYDAGSHDQRPDAFTLETAEYLRFKNNRLTPASRRAYAACLAELARFHTGRALDEFQPPAGTRLVEAFMTATWGSRAPRTYNKNLTIVHDFFEWQVRRGRLHGDPTLPLERAKPRAVHRTTFTAEQRDAILSANPDLRDAIALRLLLDYGIRKGALQRVQLEHFDAHRRRLVVFTKGDRLHRLPIPDPAFWADLDQLGGHPADYLLAYRRTVTRRPSETVAQALHERLLALITDAGSLGSPRLTGTLTEAETLLEQASTVGTHEPTRLDPSRPLGEHGVHDWWYRCLARAGLVPAGTTSGLRLHTARHTAGQRVLDKTGNLKAAQKLLGHASIQTTADSYTDWDLDQLAETMREVLTG